MRSSTETLLASDGPVVTMICTAFSNAMAVYAFGSQLRDEAGSESDLDTARAPLLRDIAVTG